MSIKRDLDLLENYKQIQRSMDVTVKISWEQALEVVVADLISKYKFCVNINDTEYKDHFAKVLRYYLTEEEFKEVEELIKSKQSSII